MCPRFLGTESPPGIRHTWARAGRRSRTHVAIELVGISVKLLPGGSPQRYSLAGMKTSHLNQDGIVPYGKAAGGAA